MTKMATMAKLGKQNTITRPKILDSRLAEDEVISGERYRTNVPLVGLHFAIP